jgi:hypothetical protein
MQIILQKHLYLIWWARLEVQHVTVQGLRMKLICNNHQWLEELCAPHIKKRRRRRRRNQTLVTDNFLPQSKQTLANGYFLSYHRAEENTGTSAGGEVTRGMGRRTIARLPTASQRTAQVCNAYMNRPARNGEEGEGETGNEPWGRRRQSQASDAGGPSARRPESAAPWKRRGGGIWRAAAYAGARLARVRRFVCLSRRPRGGEIGLPFAWAWPPCLCR